MSSTDDYYISRINADQNQLNIDQEKYNSETDPKLQQNDFYKLIQDKSELNQAITDYNNYKALTWDSSQITNEQG